MYIIKNESRVRDSKYVESLDMDTTIIFTESLDKAKKFKNKESAEEVIEKRYYKSDIYKIIEI